jgi:hypothetical protein
MTSPSTTGAHLSSHASYGIRVKVMSIHGCQLVPSSYQLRVTA